MAKVIYRGMADVRKLGKNDFANHGVEDFSATEFKKGEAVEVSAEVGKVLLNKENFKTFGKFEEQVAEAQAETATTDAADDKKPARVK